MSRISAPVRFSDHFSVDEEKLRKLGATNPTLNVDTAVFVDPLLLARSKHAEMRTGRATYERYFEQVIKLLRASKRQDDVAWKAARKKLRFPEVKWTCLGYGGRSISGSGSGGQTTDLIIETAKQIVDYGVGDTDLFVAMALFEDGFGPDRISDMTTNIIMEELINFNLRIFRRLSLTFLSRTFHLPTGVTYEAPLPLNPCVKHTVPVLLVPLDVLRDLPIALDWSSISVAASHNAELRDTVNQDIAALWERQTLEDKKAVRSWALNGKEEFGQFLTMVKGAKGKGYDFGNDPRGEIAWRRFISIATEEPKAIDTPSKLDMRGVTAVVKTIIDQFRFLVEERRLSEELYERGRRLRPEKFAQKLFFAVAYSYCKANQLDLTPEADTGNGPVDFKASLGRFRVLVEIKLSTNTKLVRGYSRQLKTYQVGEETQSAFYLVIDVGKLGKKRAALEKAGADAIKRGETSPPIVFVDGMKRPSASKL